MPKRLKSAKIKISKYNYYLKSKNKRPLLEGVLITEDFSSMKKTYCFFIILILIVSCNTNDFKLDKNKKYKHEINIKNKEFEGDGVLVLPKKDLYTIVFESDGRLDFFIFETCSRHITIEDARRGLSRKQVTINYRPNEIEKNFVCPVHIRAYAQDEKHASGFIDFEDDKHTLPALNICGEKSFESKGVSICQGKVGLYEKIVFDVEVAIDIEEALSCSNIVSENKETPDIGKVFYYNLKKDFCNILFVERRKPYRRHRLTTYGYEEVMLYSR